ncbi:alginate export family protein [Flavobacterium cellulosilyticum]|uniref:Uncharacterized protein n=1 Tax=Flavobacterium cellulosilyticum TaxID=2541731 RepID=A0A4R5CB21_9FLAO|nr:hypothetical protein [Flavobacterium cellulosilyticum]TDD94304.1 hypothetical protein E0F76_17050 [Flavobacterium cellulosilyticum]
MEQNNTNQSRCITLNNKVTSSKNISKSFFLGLTLLVLGQNVAQAQLVATGQIRERTEARGGQGTLLSNGKKGALFTSQRTRLNVGFSGYRYKVYASLQDVRVWGQDASTINRTTTEANDGIMFHEAWGEVFLNDTISTIQNLSLKIGRQEISYDDQKVLGGLDWLQQGRRHDAIILKFANKGWIADFGVAFNQNKELASGTIYNGLPSATAGYTAGTNGIAHEYKSFQYAYLGRKFFFGDVSFLFFKDDFSKFTGTAAAPTFTQGVNARTTTGFYYNVMPNRKLNLTGSLYYQGGHDKFGTSISAKLASITATYQVNRKFFIGPGVDFVSGNDGTTTATQNNRFDPLYGTPHKFWGTMDYFYVASPFGSQGLLNYFIKTKYNASDKFTLLLDIHGFESANKLPGNLSKYLGTEFDLTARYNFTKLINIEGGYSLMNATQTMASTSVKNVTNPKLTAQWAYISLKISPNFLATKKI